MKGLRRKRDVDCGDKRCSLEHHVLNTCILILPTNVTNCQIPCDMSGCETEIHHLISCPGNYSLFPPRQKFMDFTFTFKNRY